MSRTPEQVARDHLDAVLAGDPELMARDYATGAVLERPDAVFRGHAAIAAYFRTVPERLGSASVVFDDLTVEGDVATFRWHLEGGSAPASGTDTCTISDGAIVHQVVRLDGDDF